MSTTTPRASGPTGELKRWRNAVFVIFALSGVLIASFAARLPAARDALGIDPGQVGLLIVCISLGAILGLVIAPPVSHALGSRAGMAGALVFGAEHVALDDAGPTVDDERDGPGLGFRVHRDRIGDWRRCPGFCRSGFSRELSIFGQKLAAYCCRSASIGSSCEALRAG